MGVLNTMNDEELKNFLLDNNLKEIVEFHLSYLKENRLSLMMRICPLIMVNKEPELIATEYPKWCWVNKFRHTLVEHNVKWLLDNQIGWLIENYSRNYLENMHPEIMERSISKFRNYFGSNTD
jgi:hypothetical protein